MVRCCRRLIGSARQRSARRWSSCACPSGACAGPPSGPVEPRMESVSPLEKLRRQLALAVGENAVFDGWTRAAVDSAASQLGLDPAQARLAMPKTQAGMIDTYIKEVDRAL